MVKIRLSAMIVKIEIEMSRMQLWICEKLCPNLETNFALTNISVKEKS